MVRILYLLPKGGDTILLIGTRCTFGHMEQNKIEEMLQRVCQVFRIPGTVTSWEQLTSGNINTTYKVCCTDGEIEKDYLVQLV